MRPKQNQKNLENLIVKYCDEEKDDISFSDGVRDFTTDLMHICRDRGWSFEQHLKEAKELFNQEIREI